jgi:hypothetical protein
MNLRNVGVFVAALVLAIVLLGSGPAAACNGMCDASQHCVNVQGSGMWCIAIQIENGPWTCDMGSCGGGGEGGGDIPPRHHAQQRDRMEERERLALVRAIIADTKTTAVQKLRLMLDNATMTEIAAWCNSTPGCTVNMPLAPTPARSATWGWLKTIYR